jgi:P-type Ca2+ transporter type 2C
MRDGHSVMIPADLVVPGDLLVLEAGDVAAADARLRIAHALTTNEAPLTGESAPVAKDVSAPAADTPLAERHDCVFMGTSVSTGTGLAEVVATGMQTELGRIAHLLATAEDTVTPRPLERVDAGIARAYVEVTTSVPCGTSSVRHYGLRSAHSATPSGHGFQRPPTHRSTMRDHRERLV